MRGLDQKMIPVLIARDVERVKKFALAVITLTPENEVFVQENLRGKLAVIAVIGPANDPHGNHLDEALLCEVGLWRSRPFIRSRGCEPELWFGKRKTTKRGSGKRISIPKRREWFALSSEQYKIVSPVVFATIQNLIDHRISTWKTGENINWIMNLRLPTTNSRKRSQVKSFFIRNRHIPRGIQVAFPGDELFLRDIYWAELNCNPIIKKYLKEFAKWIYRNISRYEMGYRRRDFRTLVGFRSVSQLFSRSVLPRHLKIEALQFLPGGYRYPLYHELRKLLHWSGEPTREHRIAMLAPNPHPRLDGIVLRTKGEKHGCLVCEIYPRPTELRKEDCPF